MIPDAVEQLLLGYHDLVQPSRLLLELGLREQLLDLVTEVIQEDLVKAIHPKAIRRSAQFKQSSEVGVRLSGVPVGKGKSSLLVVTKA